MSHTATYPPFIDGPQDDLRALPSALTLAPARFGHRRARFHPMRVINAMTRVRRARRASRPTTEVGYCLREVRELLSIGPGAPDAITAWNRATTKHRVGSADMSRIPAGSAVFWSGGKHGHVAIAAGIHGYVFSTDILRPGYFDRVPIATIRDKWGLTLLGYTNDLNGVTIR